MGVRTRKLKLGRPTLQSQTRYEWDYLYGPLEVVECRAEFLHLPTVNLDCNALFLEHLCSSDPGAEHVVIADQAGFHLRPGDLFVECPRDSLLADASSRYGREKGKGLSGECCAIMSKQRRALHAGKRFGFGNRP